MLRVPQKTFLIFLVSAVELTAGPSALLNEDSLRLKESNKPHALLEFDMPAQLYKKVVTVRGKKLVLENTTLRFNGDTVLINDAHLHGQTTLYYERKSYSVDAAKKVKLCKGCDGLGAFYLVSLSMDRNYFHNRLCFDLLHILKLFHLQYTYAEVKINGESQGVYLLLQRPQDWTLKEIGSPFIVRRGGDQLVDRERFQKKLDKESKKKYHDQYISIYKTINQYSGKDLYDKLNEIMHLEDYLRWLAFNYVLKCGDYSDELYFYIDPETKRLRIVPWDYDDIFMTHPHEGLEIRNSRIDPSSMIFSSEDKLDVKIANDPYLYGEYLKCLKSVISELSQDQVESVLISIYADLSPMFSSQAILDAASKDGYKTSLKILREQFQIVFDFLEGQRYALLNNDLIRK